MKKLIAPALAVLLLGACSSGPSSGAMEKAVLVWIQGNSDKSAEIHDFKNGECAKSDSQPGFACSVQANVTVMHGLNSDTLQGTFIFEKIDGEWKVTGRSM